MCVCASVRSLSDVCVPPWSGLGHWEIKSRQRDKGSPSQASVSGNVGLQVCVTESRGLPPADHVGNTEVLETSVQDRSHMYGLYIRDMM